MSLSTQNFSFLPEVVARTDMVTLAPARLVQDRAEKLQIVTPPLAIPGYDMGMICHDRTHNDPVHAWLRDRIVDAF